MEQMGKGLWQIVTKVVECNPADGEILLAKWDIKDGFWKLIVLEENAWHFCYVLPKVNENDPIEIVSLQMGWCKSLLLFCMALEMAQDVAQELCNQGQPLPPHLL